MAKAKKTRPRAKRAAKSGGDEAAGNATITHPLSAESRAEARHSFRETGVHGNPAAGSAEAAALEPFHVDRLDFTYKYRGKSYGPGEDLDIPYGLAFTIGLVNVDPKNPPPAVRRDDPSDPDDQPKFDESEDNGTGGTGAPAGHAIPVSDVGSEGLSLNEIDDSSPVTAEPVEE